MTLFVNAPTSNAVEHAVLVALTESALRVYNAHPPLRPASLNTYEIKIEVKQVDPKL